MDDLLKKYGLKYEDLNSMERETYNTRLNDIQKSALSIEKIKDYIKTMKESVEQELTKIGHESKQDIFLKARLRNYMLLEAFLDTPNRLKNQLEQMVSGMIK
jgi:hypothetical protein